MKYEVTRAGDPTVAIGAYSGYRIRIVAGHDAGSGRPALAVWFRGSESLPENPIDIDQTALPDSIEARLEAGYERAVEWIDRFDGAAP